MQTCVGPVIADPASVSSYELCLIVTDDLGVLVSSFLSISPSPWFSLQQSFLSA